MHHKRHSRRKDKRKFYPCGCCVDERGDKIPTKWPQIEEDEICNGKAKKKKPRKPKEKCPVNRVHEWYRETIIDKRQFYFGGFEYWNGYSPPKNVEYVYEIKIATCIHCWKEKTVKTKFIERKEEIMQITQ